MTRATLRGKAQGYSAVMPASFTTFHHFSQTALSRVPPEAWDCKLGNRSALEWILEQYKEKKPKNPTVREKFDTYRFADYKENVIDLIARVTTVSVGTQKIVTAMRNAPR